MNEDVALVLRLLEREVKPAIIDGYLIIEGAKPNPAQADWIKSNNERLIRGVLELSGRDGYTYGYYKTGGYGEHKSSGVTLQFYNITSGENLYKMFNVELKRIRNTKHGKKGDNLPSGQFRVRKGHSFYKFWLSTQLTVPKLSTFHDYMGKLERLVYDAEIHFEIKNRLSFVKPLTVSHAEVLAAYNSLTTSLQPPDNRLTRVTYKEMAPAHTTQGLGPTSTTGDEKYGLSKQGSTGIRVINTSSISIKEIPTKDPRDQTKEEWLIDLGPMPPKTGLR